MDQQLIGEAVWGLARHPSRMDGSNGPRARTQLASSSRFARTTGCGQRALCIIAQISCPPLIAALDTEIVATEPFVHEGTLYQLRLRFHKQHDIFVIVDAFARSPLVRYAGPDWIQLHSPTCITPNDPLFPPTPPNMRVSGTSRKYRLQMGGTSHKEAQTSSSPLSIPGANWITPIS